MCTDCQFCVHQTCTSLKVKDLQAASDTFVCISCGPRTSQQGCTPSSMGTPDGNEESDLSRQISALSGSLTASLLQVQTMPEAKLDSIDLKKLGHLRTTK